MEQNPAVKLKRLKINRYRAIKPGTELHFSDGMNVLLGKNGTGKTTLLNLLAMVLGGNFHPAREEEFSVEFDIGYVSYPGIWTVKLANDRSAHVRVRKSTNELSQSINSEVRYSSDILTKTTKQLSELFLNEDGLNYINYLIFFFFQGEPNPILSIPELPEQLARLDEARDWLRNILETNTFDFSLKNHFSLRENIHPLDLSQEFTNVLAENQKDVVLVVNSIAIPSLQKIVLALGYAQGQAVLEQLSSDKDWFSFGNLRFHFTKHDGTSVRLDQLSFGEQRLFAFYYYLACQPQVVIADELTNGLHHEMISDCVAAIGDRQAFLATQNPLLLDHLQFASIDEVRSSFLLCSKETSDGQEWMAMRQMTEDEGRDFFGHYQVEQKQVNAILRWLGLW